MRRRRRSEPDPWVAAGFAPVAPEASRLQRLLPEALTSTSRRAVWRRGRARRVLAALLAGAAAWLLVPAFLPTPVETGVPVVVAAHDLAIGARLTPGDLTVRRLPASAVPGEAVASVDGAVGQVLSGRATTGEVLTAARFRGPSQLAGLAGAAGSERVAVSVPLLDDGLVSSLRPGNSVRLLQPGSGATVARAAPVLTVGAADTGAFGEGAGGGRLVLALSDAEASAVAAAMSDATGVSGFLVALEPG